MVADLVADLMCDVASLVASAFLIGPRPKKSRLCFSCSFLHLHGL
jgi:hypothetical protein